VPHYRRIRIFDHLEPDNRIRIKQRCRRAELLDVDLADVIVEQEHALPSAHAPDQQAQVTFPANVERSGCGKAQGQIRSEIEQPIIRRFGSQHEWCGLTLLQSSKNIRQSGREVVGIKQQQLTSGLRGELHRSSDLLYRAECRDDYGIDYGYGYVP
jgi:hypothetical protein